MYAPKKARRKKNSDGDPRIGDSQDDTLQMMEGNVAGLLHPVRKHGITSRGKDGDSSQHQILVKGHGKRNPGFKVARFQSFKVLAASRLSRTLKL